jgi:hypothetical protein
MDHVQQLVGDHTFASVVDVGGPEVEFESSPGQLRVDGRGTKDVFVSPSAEIGGLPPAEAAEAPHRGSSAARAGAGTTVCWGIATAPRLRTCRAAERQ